MSVVGNPVAEFATFSSAPKPACQERKADKQGNTASEVPNPAFYGDQEDRPTR
jgi:hypothetical protein